MKLDAVLAPQLLREHALKGALCVAIDVLRATTTIIAALASGAAEIRPCASAAEAWKHAGSLPRESYLLGGEEKGLRLPGFDLGNSPFEYFTPGVVGKTILFSTTNGTPAIRRAHAASGRKVLICALLNVSAVSSALVTTSPGSPATQVVILCAGRYGEPSAEDLLCAGLLIRKIVDDLHQADITPELSDTASIAAGFAAANSGNIFDVVACSEHGRYLESLGFTEDIRFACQLDTYEIVPAFEGNRITILSGLR